ncbi:hypothetical protein ACIPJ2_16025 [Curtobacterium sp. NPDC090217]|uniref:hypothetical protein n=1 Tax=Curtobacterium sp. NPDC090217 TaxID=3363970 RepID=UPI003814B869
MTDLDPRVPALWADFECRLKALEATQQLSTSTVGDTDEDAVPVDEIVADAALSVDAVFDLQDNVAAANDGVSQLGDLIAASMAELDTRLELADTNLDVARGELEESQQDITDAFGQRIDGLSDDVDAAITAAGSARTEAQAASDAALAAAGLAAAKGETIVQVSAPTGSRANPANLWINTSLDANGNPKNTPNTYTVYANSSPADPATLLKLIDSADPIAEIVVPGMTATVTPGKPVAATVNLSVSMDQNGVQKQTVALLRDGRDGSTIASQVFTDMGDSATGDVQSFTFSGTVTPTADQLVVTLQTTLDTQPTVWSLHRKLTAVGGSWSPVTDRQVIDAASAAATAAAAAQAAKDTADQAKAAAGVAQQAASDANTQALAAAGIANGKGKVIPQVSKPTGANAAVGNLWIRTTDNTPWVYDSSASDWVQVTDQTAKDAAANAVAAQQTATAAANAAAAAQATADGRPQILFSSSAGPSGTAPTGTIWFLWDSAKNVAGQWLQSGTLAAPVWTPQQIRSEVIANLDVAKLTAGSAAIADLVAQKIAASTANFQTANVSNLFVTSGATMSQAVIDFLFANVVQAKKITAGMIDVGSLTGVILTGITISGGTFTTTKSTSTQPWLRVASQSVTFYDGSDTMRGYVQAANGRLTIAGTSDTASSFFMVGRTTFTVPGIAFNQSFVSDVNMGDTYVNGDLMTSGQVRDSYSRTPMNQTVGGSAGGRRLVANSFTVPTTEAAAADQTQVVDVIQYNRTDGKVYVYADVLQNRATGARFLDDTGWVFPTLNAGTNDSNDPFRVRRLNGVVYFGGLITPTAASQTAISALAAQFRPLASIGAYLNRGGTSTTAGQWLVRVGSAGNVVLVGAGNSPGGTGNIDMAGFPPFPAGQ